MDLAGLNLCLCFCGPKGSSTPFETPMATFDHLLKSEKLVELHKKSKMDLAELNLCLCFCGPKGFSTPFETPMATFGGLLI
jgi:hypothetical protein